MGACAELFDTNQEASLGKHNFPPERSLLRDLVKSLLKRLCTLMFRTPALPLFGQRHNEKALLAANESCNHVADMRATDEQ